MKALLCLFLLLATPLRAECRLALALAMDVSRSVDAKDYVIQTEGLAAALESPEIVAAFFAPAGDVALAVYEWSGEGHQELVIDWTLVAEPEDLPGIVAEIRRLRRDELRLPTALGAGIDFGRALLDRAPPCASRVLDVSGDGRNNAGPTPERIYAQGGWDGITVNGLAIGSHELRLTEYYRASLIRGPGAFVELATRHTDFPDAIRRKLLRELVDTVAFLPCPGHAAILTPSCRDFR